MKQTPFAIQKLGAQLDEALTGVETYLSEWPKSPQDFTTEAELRMFALKLRAMRDSLGKDEGVPVIGLWRIMETWPLKNELRQKIVEAELAYERLRSRG